MDAETKQALDDIAQATIDAHKPERVQPMPHPSLVWNGENLTEMRAFLKNYAKSVSQGQNRRLYIDMDHGWIICADCGRTIVIEDHGHIRQHR